MIKTERSKFTLIMTVAAVAAGFVLRLSYPLDIEFKADERWTFEQVRAALSGGPWWGRRGNIGSFLFALLSALAAQIHLSVAFFAAALAIWSLADDRQSLRSMPFVAGAALGILPAVPWILEWTGGLSGTWRLPIFHFWLKWLTQPFGFGSDYTLGAAQFGEFLTMPILGGTRTYLVALLQMWLAALAIYLYSRAGRSILMLGSPSLRTVILGSDAAGLLVRSTLIGYGILLTLLTIRGAGLHRHYLVIAAPIMALWVARLALFADGVLLRATGRLALAGLCAGGALVSASLLHFIHTKKVIGAEFGATWAAQQSGLAPLAPALMIPARRQLP